ncbi:hypothetical protein B0T14DRAFT_498463 [Immersiella caudata]|uniref:FAD-binding PCMH-type domain-containing protein n=1 Tax=Immersiella caudata TaxID=314043 RepID=A0AA40BXQ9_9PEZI|nr:hypothetical protein B0T14DRAFT_498463 [Immersiella caudata]
MAVIKTRDATDAADFDDAVWGRHIFNRRRDTSRVPFAVCEAETAADVVACVEFAKKHNTRVSVRSGGHSWAAWSVRHGAVLVDLIYLDQKEGEWGGEFSYDPTTKIVSAPPSASGRELNDFLAEKVDAEDGRPRWFPGGHCPDVALGGFLLQGGMGWNCKNWGWACEAIVGIDVVTADAKQLHCSATTNPDLFWAARGAGPGFPAIVTRFHLQTRPLDTLYQSLYFFLLSDFQAVLRWVSAAALSADPLTEIVVVTSHFAIDEFESPMVLANFLTFQPTHEAAQIALAALIDTIPDTVTPIMTIDCEETDLDTQYAMQTQANPEDHRYCVDNVYVSNEVADLPALLEPAFTSLPSKQSAALWFAMNPTSRRQLPDMALSLQSDYYVSLYAVWEDEAEDESCVGWVRNSMKTLERSSVGSYLGDADFQARRTKFWSEGAGKRLKEVRKKWDPEGRICGYLDEGDRSGVEGLRNEFEWK